MTDLERLAVAQAVYKAVAGQVSANDPCSLRSRADAELMAMYDSIGVRSVDVKIGGQKVGTYSVQMGKATKEARSRRLRVDDPGRVSAWADENEAELSEWLSCAWELFANWVFESYGEVPDGAEVVETVFPALPERPRGTVLRVDPGKVARALRGELPSYVAGLLGGEGGGAA